MSAGGIFNVTQNKTTSNPGWCKGGGSLDLTNFMQKKLDCFCEGKVEHLNVKENHVSQAFLPADVPLKKLCFGVCLFFGILPD